VPTVVVVKPITARSVGIVKKPFYFNGHVFVLFSATKILILKRARGLTGFLLWRQYWRHFWGSFFTGAYLPQKLDLEPPTERQYKPFQKHVPGEMYHRNVLC
jgi:hypothetical protein